jgi:hypothetical protein
MSLPDFDMDSGSDESLHISILRDGRSQPVFLIEAKEHIGDEGTRVILNMPDAIGLRDWLSVQIQNLEEE